MSRIGKQPIALPAGVKAQVAEGKVRVEGPKGKLELVFHRNMKVQLDDGSKAIQVSRPDDERLNRGDDSLVNVRMFQPPQQLIHAPGADRFDTNVDDRRLGREADEVGLLVVAGDDFDLARTDLHAVLLQGRLNHRDLHIVGGIPRATVSDCEWSPMPKYSNPSRFAAAAISSRVAPPSL